MIVGLAALVRGWRSGWGEGGPAAGAASSGASERVWRTYEHRAMGTLFTLTLCEEDPDLADRANAIVEGTTGCDGVGRPSNCNNTDGCRRVCA